jgi:hypothetical protein
MNTISEMDEWEGETEVLGEKQIADRKRQV